MRLSSKNSEGSGLRKISSLRPGVSSPDGGVGSPFQPASQKAAPPGGPTNPPVSLPTHILHDDGPHTSLGRSANALHQSNTRGADMPPMVLLCRLATARQFQLQINGTITSSVGMSDLDKWSPLLPL